MSPKHELSMLLLWNGAEMSRLNRQVADQDLDLALSSNVSEMLDDFIYAGKMVIQNNPKLAQEVGYDGIVVLFDKQVLIRTINTRPIELTELPRQLEVYQLAMGRASDKLTKIRLELKRQMGARQKW